MNQSVGVRCEVDQPSSVEVRFGLRDCVSDGDSRRCDVHLGPWSRNRLGEPQAGVLATALDHVMGQIVFGQRPAGQWSVTSEMSVDFVASFEAPGPLRARGSATMIDRVGGHTEGRLYDPDGNVVAVGRAWMHYLPARAAQETAAPQMLSIPAAVSADEYLGVYYTHEGGGVVLTMPRPAAWTNFMGRVHGGVWACMAEMAASRLVAERNSALVTAGMHATYLRPGPGDAPVTVTARPRRLGSTFAVVEAFGCASDGTVCTASTVTFRTAPQRSASIHDQ